jgi:hypothetical protein
MSWLVLSSFLLSFRRLHDFSTEALGVLIAGRLKDDISAIRRPCRHKIVLRHIGQEELTAAIAMNNRNLMLPGNSLLKTSRVLSGDHAGAKPF